MLKKPWRCGRGHWQWSGSHRSDEVKGVASVANVVRVLEACSFDVHRALTVGAGGGTDQADCMGSGL